jgi:hypothetical protein
MAARWAMTGWSLYGWSLSFLGDQAAHRVPEQVGIGEAQGVDEADRVLGHGLDAVRDQAARRGDAGVVEQDDLAVGGQRVGQGGVVVIQRPHEMLEEHQRGPAWPAEPAVTEADAAGLGELRRGGVMRELRHGTVLHGSVAVAAAVSGRAYEPARRLAAGVSAC